MRQINRKVRITPGDEWVSHYPGRSPITIDAVRGDIVLVTHSSGRKTLMQRTSLLNNFKPKGVDGAALPAQPEPSANGGPLPYTSPSLIAKGQTWLCRTNPSKPAVVIDFDANRVDIAVNGKIKNIARSSLSAIYSLPMAIPKAEKKATPASAPTVEAPSLPIDHLAKAKEMFGSFIEQFRQLLVWDQTVARPLVLEGGAEEFKALIRQTVIEAIDEATGPAK